jgi:LysR family nod box-dependent transcriptional activator
MRLKRFDLNLLVSLDALLSEQSTTRAAERLFLTQPAMSSALARLRDHFKDDLLTQVGRRMVLTPLGESLVEPVREILARADTTLEARPEFDAATSNRAFTLMVSDYVSTVLMAEFVRRLEEFAPLLHFQILPHGANPWEAVEKREVDLLIMPTQLLPQEHPSELLFEEHFVCVAWSGNPLIGETISREQYLELEHVVARPGTLLQRRHTIEANFIEREGGRRRIGVVVAEFSVLPHYLIGSRRIATMHSRLARLYARYLPLKVLALPFPGAKLAESVAWHQFRGQDLGLAWIRRQLKLTAAELAPPTPIPRDPYGGAAP